MVYIMKFTFRFYKVTGEPEIVELSLFQASEAQRFAESVLKESKYQYAEIEYRFAWKTKIRYCYNDGKFQWRKKPK
jgi:hypothetical protein